MYFGNIITKMILLLMWKHFRNLSCKHVLSNYSIFGIDYVFYHKMVMVSPTSELTVDFNLYLP